MSSFPVASICAGVMQSGVGSCCFSGGKVSVHACVCVCV